MALFGIERLIARDVPPEKKVWTDEFSLKKAGCVIMIVRLSTNLSSKGNDVESANIIRQLLEDLSHKILQCQNRLEIKRVILDEVENWESFDKPVHNAKTGEINWKNAFTAIRKIKPELRSYHMAVGTALHIVHREFWS